MLFQEKCFSDPSLSSEHSSHCLIPIDVPNDEYAYPQEMQDIQNLDS